MKTSNNLMKMAAGSVFALAIVNVQAATLINGGFETVMGDTGAVTISSGGYTDIVGVGMALQAGTYSDGSTTADLIGWVGNANVSVVAGQSPHTGNHCIALNGSGWGNPGGATTATTILSDSIGTSDGAALTISLWATGSAFPVAFDLLANGTALTPIPSVDPTVDGTWQEFTRSYDLATMAAVSGQDLTIQFGLGPTGDGAGGQVRFDDVTVVPEPATMSLLALGGLAMLRRRR